MGNSLSPSHGDYFQATRSSVEERVGKLSLHSRYHREPSRLQSDYVMSSRVLGRGVNGEVHLATSRKDCSQKVAVKSFALRRMCSDSLENLKAEIGHYLIMDHPHITRLFDVYESKYDLHILMEFLEGGSVFDRLAEKKFFSEKEACSVLRQILLALNYMHEHGFVHRDIKLENMVYDSQKCDYIKLIDFGLCTQWDPSEGEYMNASVGSLSYVAPEVLQKKYTSQCDLWSVGVVAYTLLAGRFPFQGYSDAELMGNICAGRFVFDAGQWNGISLEAKRFVSGLLCVNPSRRLSAQTALEHYWIKSGHVGERVELSRTMESLRLYGRASSVQRCCAEVLGWSCSNEDQAKVRDHFLILNTSCTGAITFPELRSFMRIQFHEMEESEFDSICHALDHNNDQTIHYSSFLAALMGSEIPLTHEIVAMAMKRFDFDISESVSANNVSRFLCLADCVKAEGFIHEVSRGSTIAAAFNQSSAHLEGRIVEKIAALPTQIRRSNITFLRESIVAKLDSFSSRSALTSFLATLVAIIC